MRRRPLTILSSIDPVLRDSAIFGLVTDAPGTVAVRHDIVEDALRRVVVDATGVVEDTMVPLEHACLSCAVREDAVPVLESLADSGRWQRIVLALPVSAEALPATRTLGWATERDGALRRLRLSAVVGVVDVTTVEHDLLDDDLLVERNIALTEDDRRSVGEALVAQLAHVDVVAVAGTAEDYPLGSDLVDHVRSPGARRVDGLHQLDASALFATRHEPMKAEHRTDPLNVRAASGPSERGVWSLELSSPRPFHPDRLFDRIDELGSGRLVSRGVFWVPTRPGTACVWDGAGGQLSIGALGPWERHTPRTRIVVTGVGDEAPRLRRAFAELLLDDEEMSVGLYPWLGHEDALAPWLGDRSVT